VERAIGREEEQEEKEAEEWEELGFTKGMGSNVWVLKVQNGEYAGANEPQKL
jgi:hypothetical protein